MMNSRVSQKRRWMGFVLTLMMAVTLSFMLSIVSHAESAGKIKTASAKIRKEASTSSDTLASLVQNSKVDIISQTTGSDGMVWYKIWVDGTKTGYVRSDLVTITDGSTPATSNGNDNAGSTTVVGVPSGIGEAEQLTPLSATVTGSNNVRVRTSANTSSNNNILTTVANGSAVTVVARTTGSDGKTWYQVKFTADGKDVIGYIRNDYLNLSGEPTPLSQEVVQQPEETKPVETPQQNTPQENNEPETHKRFETKLISEKWYILDYEVGQQYDIAKLFAAGDENKALYDEEHSKATALTVWLVIVGILAAAAIAAVIYLLYRLRECKEAAFIASIENNTVNRTRTSERPKTTVVHSVGPEAKKPQPAQKEGQKPVSVQNGQKPAVAQKEGQRPVSTQNGQRPANAQNGQRPANAQNGQRPANAQNGQRPASAQNGQRPASAQNGQRPANAQNGQRPANAQNGQRPANAQNGQKPAVQKPAAPKPTAQKPAAKTKNFMQEEDEFEFEFLNWDNDEE